MMYWASKASSRTVILCSGSGSPVEFLKTDWVRPSSRARLVICSAKASSDPAMPSAMAIQASLADCTSIAYINCSTLNFSPILNPKF